MMLHKVRVPVLCYGCVCVHKGWALTVFLGWFRRRLEGLHKACGRAVAAEGLNSQVLEFQTTRYP